MSARALRRPTSIGGWAGVLGVVVPGIGLLVLPIWEFPTTEASGADVVAFARDHRAALQVVMALNAVGVTLWTVLCAGAWERLRRHLPDDARADDDRRVTALACFAIGSAGFTTLLLAGFVCFDLVVYRLPGADEAALLYDLTFGLLAMSGLPTAIGLGGFAVAARGVTTIPSWNRHLAAATAAAHVLLLASFVVPSGPLSLEGAVITVIPALLWAWVLATGVVLLRTPERA